MDLPRLGHRWSWIGLGGAAVVLVAIGAVRWRHSTALRRANAEVVQTADVLGAVSVLGAERREREIRYIRWITRSDQASRLRAAASTPGVDSALNRLQGLVGEDPDAARQMRMLTTMLRARAIALQDTTPPPNAEVALRAAEAFGDSAELILAGIRNREVSLLESGRAEAARVEIIWRRWMLTGTGSALLVLLVAGASLRRLDREQRESRKLLEASEARFRAAAEGGFDAFLLLDDDQRPGDRDSVMRVVDLNQHAAMLLSLPREELVGKPWSEVGHAFLMEDEDFLHVAAAVMRSGKAKEDLFAQPNGERPRWLRRLMIPTSSGLAISCRDITEERDLRDQLAQSQKLDALGRMASGVAHDFNNILTVLRSECDLILDEPTLPAQTRTDIHEMIRAVDRAASLTQRLLAFSRKQVSAPRAVAVDLAIEDMRVFLVRMLPQNITLEVDAAPDLEPIVIDPVHFDQILLNLTANARDAMPSGGRIEIHSDLAHRREALPHRHGSVPAGRWVRIRVTDSGHGMSGEVLHRLFEPFFTTKAQGRGTGLGLATVHGAVVQSNGHIMVESAPDRGATFTLFFPAQPQAERGPSLHAPAGLPLSSVGGQILLAEDEPAVRAVMERILKRAGYQVLSAPSGEEAMELFAKHWEAIDLLVTDMVMPGMNGQELAARATHMKPELPVLFVSGYVGDAVQVPANVVESGRFLQKPFTADELIERLRQMGAA